MHMLPKVSFITPSFNQGRFIKRTIESILSQDIPDFEHVVMDGGSTDETVEILEQYEGRLRWVSERDNGQTHAINKGLQATSGEIIGWLNSDDMYYPGAVRAAYEFLQANEQIDLVYGDANYIDEEDRITELYPTEPWNFRRFKDSCFICQPATFFRRRVVEHFGLLDERIHFCMDYEYWLRLASAGAKFAYLPRVLAGSRMYPTNKTLGHTEKHHVEVLDTMRRLFGQVPDQWILNYAHMVLRKRGVEGMNPFSFALGVAWVAYDAALRWNGQVPPSIQMHLKEAEAGLDAALQRIPLTSESEESMRVLLRLPSNYKQACGSDADMAIALREAVGRNDISIDISTRPTQPLRNYDLVHCVSLECPHETYQTAMNALAWDRPFVLTPFYWDNAELSRFQDMYWRQPPRPKHLIQEWWEEQLATLEHTDIMLPTGNAERLSICREFGVNPECVIVPASVPTDIMTAQEDPALRERYGGRDFVLSVGRIEDRRNQLTLIRACERLRLPLVIVGSASIDQFKYFEDCKQAAGPNTFFVPWLERGHLLTYYATAKVHAMASWYELPGLTTLEAATARANVVSTNRGSAEDHLGELAWYCDPSDVRSVADAVRAAYEAPRRPRQQVIGRVAPGWVKSAEAMVHAYELACSRPKRPPSPKVLAMLLLTKEHAREHELKLKSYQELIHQIREIVSTTLPRDATTIVVSKGDNELLKLNGRQAWHFPQTEGGVYAGYHPADSAAAITHLEALRGKGGEFLLFPSTAFWWLDYYGHFHQYLSTHYRCIWSDKSCIIYQCSDPESGSVEAR